MNEYLLWAAKEGYTIPGEGPQAIAKFIAESADEGDTEPFKEFLSHVHLVGKCWQGRERDVGIDGAGWTDAEPLKFAGAWAQTVWLSLTEDWSSTLSDAMLEKVNA